MIRMDETNEMFWDGWDVGMFRMVVEFGMVGMVGMDGMVGMFGIDRNGWHGWDGWDGWIVEIVGRTRKS
jgi:hypothetical protein